MSKQTYKTQIVLIFTVTVIGLMLPLVAQAGAGGTPREGTPQAGQSISRRADGSSSGPSRRYGAITPVPLNNNDDGEEPIPRLGSGGSPITVNIETSRTSGVAPLAVFFDVVGDIESPNLTWDEIESHEFIWDFGEGTEADTSSDGRYFSGYMAAHVYETPDTYTVTLTVKQDGQVVATDTEVIDVSSFTGRTLCVSPSSDFADCPSSNPADHFTDFTTAWNQITTNSRLLLHRGETWTLTQSYSSSVPGPVIVGAYGSGEKPQISFGLNQFDPRGYDWRFMDLAIDEGSVPFGEHADGTEKLILRADVSNFNHKAYRLGYDGLGLFVVDSTAFNVAGGAGEYGIFNGAGERFALLNSIIDNNFGGEHVLRNYASKVLIADSVLKNPATNGKVTLALKGGTVTSGEPDSLYILVTNLTSYEDSLHAAINPENSGSEQYTRNVIIEKSRFLPLPLGGSSGTNIIISAFNVVVRNNIGLNTDKFVDVAEHPLLSPSAENVKIYGNSVFSNNLWTHGIKSGGNVVDISFKNNIIYSTCTSECTLDQWFDGPDLDSSNNIGYFPNMPSQCVDASGGNTCTDPLFVDPDGLDNILGTLDDDLRLQPNSPAIDSGAPLLQLFEDVDRNPRPIDGPDADTIPQWDIGAYEYSLLTLPGDFDQDGDVDMDDYAVFEAAYAGSGRPPANDDYRPDLDGDGDVDLDDFSIFAANYTG